MVVRRLRKRRNSPKIEALEQRIVLTAMPAWTHLSSSLGDLESPTPGGEQTASLVFDVDGDSLNDFVIAEWTQAPSVVWYQRNPMGGWTKYVVDNTQVPIEAGGTFHDIDGDGDMDIVFGGLLTNEMWWWENPSPNFDPGMPWTRRTIKNTGGVRWLHDQQFGDVDGDGVTELVSWDQGDSTLLILEIPADPRNHSGEWARATIANVTNKYEGMAIADIDLDGTNDIVGAGRWYKHIAGTSPADWQFQESVIDGGPNREFTRTAVGQLVPGGRPEVVLASGDGDGPLTWYEWNGLTWDAHELINNVIHGHSLAVEDINGDGHVDIFIAEMGDPGDGVNADSWVLYGDSAGNFEQQTVSVGIGNHESKVADLDGDGDLDILSKPHKLGAPRIDVFLNNGTRLPLDGWQRHEIDGNLPSRTIFVGSGDLNGDNFPDLMSGGWLYQNPLQVGSPWTRTTIGVPLNQFAIVADFDGDGDLDIFGTQGVGSASNNELAWARNDGGTFTVLNNIQTVGSGDFLQGVVVDRFGPNGTGPLQIALSWHNGGGGIQLVTPGVDPSLDQWTSEFLSATTLSEQLSSGDIDGDDDADLLLGTQWLRNDGASTWTPFTLNPTAGDPDRNRLADVNGDGRLDAVVGFEAISISGKLAWYEQPAGDPTGTWTEHVIDTLIGPMSVDVRDMDGDGDLDVVVGEHNLADPASARIFVYENTDGAGTTWQQHLVHTGDEHHDGAHVVDIEGDGDFDIVSIGWNNDKVVLYENRAIVSGTTTVSSPTITPGGGVFADSVDVTLATETPGAALYYTLDGSVPTEASTLYTGLFTLTDSATLRVRGFLTGFDPSPVSSADFTILSSIGERVSDDLLVLYEFAEGSGDTVTDTSGVGSPLNLTIGSLGNVTWSNEVLTVNASTLITTGGPASKIFNAVTASNAITIEAWVIPANTTQNGPARIVTMSADGLQRNFTFGQGVFGGTGDRYEVRLRTTTTGTNGSNPATPSPVGSLNGQRQHVVYTRDAVGNATLYIDGVEVVSTTISGELSNWDSSFEFALANELTGDRPWLGSFDLVAIYSDALTPTEVAQNYIVGPIVDPPAIVTGSIINGSAQNPNRSGIGTLALTFDRIVNITSPGSLILFNHTSQSIVDVSGATLLNNGTSSVTWNLTGVSLPDGWYTAELPASESTPNLASTHTVVFSKLSGDLDGDGVVNFNDTVPISINFGATGGAAYRDGDADGDGDVNFNDTVPLSIGFSASLTNLTFDFGDAPEADSSFSTLLANDGPRHVMTGNSLYLGLLRDHEPDGQPTSDASGDELDEEGVSIVGNLDVGTNVDVTVTSSDAGFVNGWVDFNQDGDWDDPGEHVFTDTPVVAGPNSLAIAVPAGAVLGSTIARFRITATAGYSYVGLAPNGEVEDHQLTVADPAADLVADSGQGSLTMTSHPTRIRFPGDSRLPLRDWLYSLTMPAFTTYDHAVSLFAKGRRLRGR